MTAKMGFNCKMYYNDTGGTYAIPVWVELTAVKNSKTNLAIDVADATIRGNNGWKTNIAGLKDGSIDFDYIFDTADSNNFGDLKTAFLAGTPLEFLVLDGSRTVAGSQGLRAQFYITDFSRNEGLTDVVSYSLKLVPALAGKLGDTAVIQNPEWHVAV